MCFGEAAHHWHRSFTDVAIHDPSDLTRLDRDPSSAVRLHFWLAYNCFSAIDRFYYASFLLHFLFLVDAFYRSVQANVECSPKQEHTIKLQLTAK
ncbi:hypothetical protein MRB53_040807 [Persea americana]|nr:hypothetical protein MRB53_040807 [Persea americana]